jgi:hypothetical protein
MTTRSSKFLPWRTGWPLHATHMAVARSKPQLVCMHVHAVSAWCCWTRACHTGWTTPPLHHQDHVGGAGLLGDGVYDLRVVSSQRQGTHALCACWLCRSVCGDGMWLCRWCRLQSCLEQSGITAAQTRTSTCCMLAQGTSTDVCLFAACRQSLYTPQSNLPLHRPVCSKRQHQVSAHNGTPPRAGGGPARHTCVRTRCCCTHLGLMKQSPGSSASAACR